MKKKEEEKKRQNKKKKEEEKEDGTPLKHTGPRHAALRQAALSGFLKKCKSFVYMLG